MPYAIGLMSGTSLDGCDAALIRIDGDAITPVAFETLPMPPGLRQRILDCCSLDKSNIALTCSVNVEIGAWFAKAAKAVLESSGVPRGEVECIGSHGQTVYHIPEAEAGLMASTLQLGEPAVIAYETGLPVVSGMRAMDMAAGGRGAPLVPYAEYRLYRCDRPRALQNLGGIGNVTVLPAGCTLDEVFAFDTGPANMIIDALAQHFFGRPYDEGGALSAQGNVSGALLDEWMAVPFVTAPPPKATGREIYGAQFVDAALRKHPHLSGLDFLATATQYTAACVAVNYERYVFPRCPVEEIILSGGGAHNHTLRRMIAEALPGLRVLTQEDLGFSSDAKEAAAFALMAYETIHLRPSNVPAATGAKAPVILGNITPAPYK